MGLKLGELLVAKKIASPEQVKKALEAQKAYGGRLGTNLVEMGFVRDVDLVRVLSEQLHIPPAKLEEFNVIPKAVLNLVPTHFVKKHKLIPLKLEQRLRVAICDPSDISAIDQLGFMTGKGVQATIAPEVWISAAMERYYGIARDARFMTTMEEGGEMAFEVVHEVASDVNEQSERSFKKAIQSLPLPGLLSKLAQAESKEVLFEDLLDFLGVIFPRIAVYVNRKDHFTGWLVRGFPTREREFAHIKISSVTSATFSSIIRTKKEASVKFSEKAAEELGFRILNLEPSTEVWLCPILFRSNVLAIILAVPETPAQVSFEHHRTAIIACERTGLALELLALRSQILAAP